MQQSITNTYDNLEKYISQVCETLNINKKSKNFIEVNLMFQLSEKENEDRCKSILLKLNNIYQFRNITITFDDSGIYISGKRKNKLVSIQLDYNFNPVNILIGIDNTSK